MKKYEISYNTSIRASCHNDAITIQLKQIVGRAYFSDQFRIVIISYKRIRYKINIMRQSACLLVNPIMINNFVARLWVGRQTQ